MKFKLYRIIGFLSRILFPGWGSCSCCGRTWNVVHLKNAHFTDCGNGRGCFPLCKYCWQHITVIERLIYYRQLYFDVWKETDLDTWELIQDNVYKESYNA